MTGDNSVEAIAQGREQSIEKKSGSEKESSSEHPSKAEAAEKTLKTVQPSEEDSVISEQEMDISNDHESRTIQEEVTNKDTSTPQPTALPASIEDTTDETPGEENETETKPTQQSQANKENPLDNDVEKSKNVKVAPVRQQPIKDVEKRQQTAITKVASTPADLSKDWDMDDDASVEEQSEEPDDKSDKAATKSCIAETNANEIDKGAETIENIESFIQEEPKDTSTPAVHRPKNGQSIASVTTKPTISQQEGKVGEKRKLERTVGKRTEEWVTMIFGEDGKQVDGADRKASLTAKKSKKSVYDLNPDGEDFSSKDILFLFVSFFVIYLLRYRLQFSTTKLCFTFNS